MTDEEFRTKQAADAIYEAYLTCFKLQAEAATVFHRAVSSGDPRPVSHDEVRGWITGVVRGSLVPRPPEPTPWQHIKIAFRRWLVME